MNTKAKNGMIGRRTLLALGGAVLVAILGCDLAPPTQPLPLESVSGRVMLDGKPAVGAKVVFVPLRYSQGSHVNPISFGVTDDAGQFSLATYAGAKGAVIGKHRVMIVSPTRGEDSAEASAEDSTEAAKDEAELEQRIPARYNRRSEEIFEVDRGTGNQANFDIKSLEAI